MRLPYTLDAERPVQIGLIVLQADETLESDLRRLMPDEVSILVSRVPSGEELTKTTLREMEAHLTASAALLPRGARLAAVGYGCTSGAAEIGADRVADLVRAGSETPLVTDPVSALVAACMHLGLSRIGLVSPYVEGVSERLRDVLSDAGLAVTQFASFEEPIEENVARIAESSVAAAALEVGRNDDCDAVFLSCTNLRTLGAIPRIEAEIDKPILSSNQVLAWHLCKLVGRPPRTAAPGLLFGTMSDIPK